MNPLANALQALAPSSAGLAATADQAGVSRRQASLARAGKPISAGSYLALCGSVGLDPMDGLPRPVKSVAPIIEWWLLSAALYITRGLQELDQRRAANLIGTSAATVCRIEAGHSMSIGNMVKVCRFIGVHPDGYTAPHAACDVVSRETTTETHCSNAGNP